MIKKVTPKITPEKVVVKANTIVKKFYNKDGILTLSSEFDKKSGKIKKDVFIKYIKALVVSYNYTRALNLF